MEAARAVAKWGMVDCLRWPERADPGVVEWLGLFRVQLPDPSPTISAAQSFVPRWSIPSGPQSRGTLRGWRRASWLLLSPRHTRGCSAPALRRICHRRVGLAPRGERARHCSERRVRSTSMADRVLGITVKAVTGGSIKSVFRRRRCSMNDRMNDRVNDRY